MGANVYIRTDLHERIIKKGHNVGEYTNRVVKEALDREEAGVQKKDDD